MTSMFINFEPLLKTFSFCASDSFEIADSKSLIAKLYASVNPPLLANLSETPLMSNALSPLSFRCDLFLAAMIPLSFLYEIASACPSVFSLVNSNLPFNAPSIINFKSPKVRPKSTSNG